MEGDSGHITFVGFSLFFSFLFFSFSSFSLFLLFSFSFLFFYRCWQGHYCIFFLFSSPVRSSIPLSLDHFLFFFHQVFFILVTAPVWRYPFGPPYVNLLEPFPFLAGDQLVAPIGVTHISLPLHQIQSREQEKKE